MVHHTPHRHHGRTEGSRPLGEPHDPVDKRIPPVPEPEHPARSDRRPDDDPDDTGRPRPEPDLQ
jgi:hypothetical protein